MGLGQGHPDGGDLVAQRRQVKARLDLLVSDLGETKLKNIADPVKVYSVQVGVAAASPRSEPPASLALPDRPSIAVLPFQNLSGDPEQDYFADGVVEDIITGLSRVGWLFVIARNSSFVYKGRAVDVKLVGRELGVRYVLEGSVRKGGNRLRITGQLIEAETATHLWADRYDGALEDVFDLQDRITETVISVLEPSIRSAEIERARRKPPENLGAYDLYLRALPYLTSMMPEDANRGMDLLRQALDLDPEYAAAHAFLAWAYEIRLARGGFSEADLAAGLNHARAAVSHGADDPTALAVASLALLHLGRDFNAASSAVARALELNRSCAVAYFLGSHVHAFCGETTVSRDYARSGLRLSPFDPMAWIGHQSLGLSDLRDGHYDEAAAHFGKAMQINPRFSFIQFERTAALALAGRQDEAASNARRLLELEPAFRSGDLLGFLSFLKPELTDALQRGSHAVGLPG